MKTWSVLLSFIGEAAIQLSKYLLKTLCSELTNVIVTYLAEDLGLISKIPEEVTLKVCIMLFFVYIAI